MISFENVSMTLHKPRRKTVVFEACSVALPTDRSVGVFGHPGAGKTTLLQLANGALDPDRGRVRRTGLVSATVASASAYSMSLTVRENMVFICRLFGFDPKPVIAFIEDFTVIGRNLDRPFAMLERDLRAEFLFTASYAMPFDVYCVDENPVGGRPAFREELEALVAERRRSAGFLICTSSPNVLRKYCDAFYILKDRTVREVASAAEAIETLGPAPRARNADGTDGPEEATAEAADSAAGDGVI